MKKFLIVIFVYFFILFFPSHVFAALYINEFSSNGDLDWVEIYNSDGSSVDLSNYVLRDSTDSNKIDLTGTISGTGFATFDWSNKLNNDGDTIRLLTKTEGGTENSDDEVKYGSSGGVSAPASGQSAGRIPDGSSNIVLISSPTRNSSNNSASLAPTNTPVPTNTTKPTDTPVPTATPKPTATPTPKPTLTPSPTPTPSLTPYPSKSPSGSELELASDIDNNPIGNATTTPAPDAGAVLGASNIRTPLMYIFLGLIFLSVCGILAFFQFGDKIVARFKRLRNKE